MKPARKTLPIILEKKLGREKAYGLYEHDTPYIQIDPRVNAKQRLEIIIHETLHYLFPTWSEEAVENTTNILYRIIWKDRYRRIEK